MFEDDGKDKKEEKQTVSQAPTAPAPIEAF